MLFWRGWGISVALFFLLWIAAGVGLLIGSGSYEPDQTKVAMGIQWGLAVVLALTAASVFATAAWRRRRVPSGHDDFMFLPLEFWPYILVVIALGVTGATGAGYRLFA